MKRLTLIFISLVGALFIAGCGESEAPKPEAISWEELPKLPNTVGLGGAFAGVSNGALIVAGGANFPDAPEWEGGTKVWYDELYVLTPKNKEKEWLTGFKLNQPLAYGASVSTGDSLILIGGRDAERRHDGVTQLTWNPEAQKIEQSSLPSLPQPLSYSGAAKIGDTLYVVGGQVGGSSENLSNVFWSLNLSNKDAEWEVLEPWEGPARRKAIVAFQNEGNRPYLYIIGGEDQISEGNGKVKTQPLTDGYRYSLGYKQWERINDAPHPVTAAPGLSYGQSHILIFGGATGEYLGQILRDDHPGFSPDLLVYHTITDTWVIKDEIPLSVVTSNAVSWGGGIAITSGEIRPSRRTAKVQLMVHDTGARATFGITNYLFVIFYMVGLVYMGIYFSKREKGTDDYFLAGRRIPWWASGLSVLGTGLSALTYISLPALVYGTDWFPYPGYVGLILVPIVTIYFYLPFFRRLNVVSAFEYLEKRFNLPVRLYGSAQFIIFQLVRISIVMYLPAIVLSTITGINIYMCILSMGLLSTFYTVLGGIEAVVWTDVFQVIIFFGGIIAALIVIPFHIDGGVMEMFKTGLGDDKFRILYLEWDITATTFWVVVVGGGFGTLIQYTADQSMIQRYLTTKTEKDAAKGLWLNVAMTIPTGLLFYCMGTALYVYYKSHPSTLNMGMQNDAILPLFISQRIPVGLAGFVIAAIFSAAMSSLDSGMNSMATAFVTDFYRRFKPQATEHSCLNLARWITLIIGVFGTGVAILMVSFDIKSASLFFTSMIGLFSSGLAGLFALGIFTRRSNGIGAFIGAITSAVVLYFIKFYTPINFYMYAFIGFVICFIVGYIASLIIPDKEKTMEGLTLYTSLPRED